MPQPDGRPWLPVSVDGNPPIPFLLQASAGAIAITGARSGGSLPASAGMLSLESGLLPGIAGGSLVKQRRLSLDSLLLREQSILLVEPSAWSHGQPGGGAAGVLGYDLLRRFVVELDLGAGRVVLHRPGSFQFAGLDEVARLLVLERRPYLDLPFEAGGAAQRWLRLQFEPAASIGICLDSRIPQGAVRVAERRIPVGGKPCPPEAGIRGRDPRDGMLGSGVLQQLVVVVDYEGGRIGFRAR